MDITKARKVVELSKEGKKILVTLWDDKISTCVVEDERQYCESCQGDEEICNDYINYLKEKGYEATEVALGVEVEESLPRFLEEREVMEPEAVEEVAGPGSEEE